MRLFQRMALAMSMAPLGVVGAEARFGDRPVEDDFSDWCDRSGRSHYARLKCLRLGEGRLSFGGRWRERLEWSDPYDYGRAGRGGDATFLHRLLVHADWRPSEQVRAYLELGNHLQHSRPGGPRLTDHDPLDLSQAFVELRPGQGGFGWRLGRQEVIFGANRLIAPRESANIRLSFDGALGQWQHGHWSWRGMALKPVEVADGVFNNRTQHSQRLWGLYGQYAPAAWAGWKLDTYGLGFHSARSTLATVSGRERRVTLGARLHGRRGHWDMDNELIVQRGRLAGRRAQARALFTHQGYTFDARWRPRLGLRADYTSGDRRPGPGTIGTFRPLFGPANYITDANTNVMVNLIALYPSIKLQPLPPFSVAVGYAALWRASRQDAFYGSGLSVLVPGNASRARYIGGYKRLTADWRFNPYLALHLDLSHFEPGAFARAGRLRAGWYGVTSLDVRF